MAYIKITNGEQQAYGIGQLRRDNKTVSFPKVVEASTLASYGVYSAVIGAVPSYNSSTQVATQNETATEVGGQWTYEYTVRNKTSEVLAAEVDSVTASARATRNGLLAATDYMALSDVTMSEAVTTYRQALRDITSHANWPNMSDSDWPTKPGDS
jgi:folate-dependent tRNA-U54 methylase TrmFO/GidA